MATVFKEIEVRTGRDFDVVDITGQVEGALQSCGMKNGLVNIFISGSTASVSTIEYEPNLISDLKAAVERLTPSNIQYKHHMTWGDDNGKSHIRATIFGPGTTVPFRDGHLLLGTWQQIVLLDFDVPSRTRRINLTFVGE